MQKLTSIREQSQPYSLPIDVQAIMRMPGLRRGISSLFLKIHKTIQDLFARGGPVYHSIQNQKDNTYRAVLDGVPIEE
jgi:hypothetical protein